MAQFIVDIELSGAERLARRQVNDVIRDALEAMILHWRRRYLPKHFTKAGAREYGYQPRGGERNPLVKGSYTNRKLRLFSHTLPNVYTGELRRQCLQGVQRVTAKVTSTRAHGHAVLPRKANFRLHELGLVSSAERAELAKFFVARVEFGLARAGATGGRAAAGIRQAGAAAAAA